MANNEPITTQQFYDKMDKVERRLTNKIDNVINGVGVLNREMGEIKKCVEAQDTRIETCEGDIKNLEKSDRKMSAISTFAAMVGAAIMDQIRRG